MAVLWVGCVLELFIYADDLELLTPSVYYLHQMAHICEDYTKGYDITFNAKKSQVIFYKAYYVRPPDQCIIINGVPVKCFNNEIHLGHILTENVFQFNASKRIDFNRQCNMFFVDFKHCMSHIRNILFQRYFYGSQLLPHFDVKIQEFSVPQIKYTLGGTCKMGSNVYFLLIVAMVLLLRCHIVLL